MDCGLLDLNNSLNTRYDSDFMMFDECETDENVRVNLPPLSDVQSESSASTWQDLFARFEVEYWVRFPALSL